MFWLKQFWPFSRVAGCLLAEPTAPRSLPPSLQSVRVALPTLTASPGHIQLLSLQRCLWECSILSDCRVLLVLPSTYSVLGSALFGSVPSSPCPCSGFVMTLQLQGLSPAEVGVTMTGWSRLCTPIFTSPSPLVRLTPWKSPKSGMCLVLICGSSHSKVAGVGAGSSSCPGSSHLLPVKQCGFSRANQFGEVLLIFRFNL